MAEWLFAISLREMIYIMYLMILKCIEYLVLIVTSTVPHVLLDVSIHAHAWVCVCVLNIWRLQASTKLTSEDIIELQYADDCCLVGHTPETIQNTLAAAVTAHMRMGLTINTQKTKMGIICHHLTNFTVEGQQLAIIPTFKHLGSVIYDDSTMDDEIKNRFKRVSASFGHQRRRVFLKSNINLHTKILVYWAVCISLPLLYGCEAWTVCSHHLRNPEAFHVGCIQKILGII